MKWYGMWKEMSIFVFIKSCILPIFQKLSCVVFIDSCIFKTCFAHFFILIIYLSLYSMHMENFHHHFTLEFFFLSTSNINCEIGYYSESMKCIISSCQPRIYKHASYFYVLFQFESSNRTLASQCWPPVYASTPLNVIVNSLWFNCLYFKS